MISAGNSPTDRDYADSWHDFYMVDTNQPFVGAGSVRDWEIWAENNLPVQMVLYSHDGDRWKVLGKSEVQTPEVGYNKWELSRPIDVSGGDFVGFYFPERGCVSFDLHDSVWLRNNMTGSVISGRPGSGEVGFIGSTNRVYSIRATGTSVINMRPGADVQDKHCTDLPQGITIREGQLCFVTASAQSSADQSVKILAPDGSVLFEASGRSSSGGAFTLLKTGTFTAPTRGVYEVHMTPNAGVLGSGSNCHHNSEILMRTFGFGANDGGCEAGDRDFNDLYVSITIFGRTG